MPSKPRLRHTNQSNYPRPLRWRRPPIWTLFTPGERWRHSSAIEDAAHATGTSYKASPHWRPPSTAIFSFHADKNITCAEGGIVVTINSQSRRCPATKAHGLGVDTDAQSGSDARHKWSPAPGHNIICPDLNAAIALTVGCETGCVERRAAPTQRSTVRRPAFQPLEPSRREHSRPALFIIRVDEARCGITRQNP